VRRFKDDDDEPDGDPWEKASISTWSSRRDTTRKLFAAKLQWDASNAEAAAEAAAAESPSAVGDALASTAFVVAILAVVLRIGGRAALLGLLGVDASADAGVKETIDGFVDSARAFGGETGLVAIYLAGFIAAKCLCLDALTFALALASGVLFGGVVQGALVATTCATVGSSAAFAIARFGKPGLRGKLLRLVRREPRLRALERAVTERGFQTVLVLRLAPVLPIPISAYNYLYGATEIQFSKFAPAMFLGSLKPYAFDSYLGIFGKSMLDTAAEGPAFDLARDLPLLGVFAVFIAIGSLSSELATTTWAAMDAEMAGDAPDGLDTDDWVDVLDLRDAPPWRAARFVQSREPDWSRVVRGRADRARYALATMATEEFVQARREFALLPRDGQPRPKPPRRPDAGPEAIPEGGDATLDIPASILESILFSFVVGRAVLDEKSLLAETEEFRRALSE